MASNRQAKMNGSTDIDNYCPFRKSVDEPDNPILRLSAHNLFYKSIRLRGKLARSHNSNNDTVFCSLDKAGEVGAEPPQEPTGRKKTAESRFCRIMDGTTNGKQFLSCSPLSAWPNVRQKSGQSRVGAFRNGGTASW